MNELLQKIAETQRKLETLADGRHKEDTIRHLKRLKRKLRMAQKSI